MNEKHQPKPRTLRARIARFYEDPIHRAGCVEDFSDSGLGSGQGRGRGWIPGLEMSANALEAWDEGERPKSEIRKADLLAAVEEAAEENPRVREIEWTVKSVLADPDLERGTVHHIGRNRRSVIFINLVEYFVEKADLLDWDPITRTWLNQDD